MKKNNQPATFGGAGFQYRQPQWQKDLGSLWKNWTVSCDGSPLQEVLLAMPADVYADIPDIDAALMLDIPDIEKMREQCQTIAEIYEKNKIYENSIKINKSKKKSINIYEKSLKI